MATKGHYSAGKKSSLASSLTNVGYGAGKAGTLPGGGKLGVYEPRHARP